jgi:cupin superfamily acireductone dioxygenase involved in methionine salvage
MAKYRLTLHLQQQADPQTEARLLRLLLKRLLRSHGWRCVDVVEVSPSSPHATETSADE